jgi:hypothetical protein
VAFKGTVRGAVIELDEPLALPEGTRVHLEIVGIGDPPLPKGSPQLVLQLLAGTLTEEEAEAIRKFVYEEIRRIDPELWQQESQKYLLDTDHWSYLRGHPTAVAACAALHVGITRSSRGSRRGVTGHRD